MSSPAATPDPGLQAERTALAWRRTAMSTAALAVLLLRESAIRGWGTSVLAPAGAFLALMLVTVVCAYRGRELHHRVDLARARPVTAAVTALTLTATSLLVMVSELAARI